MSEIEPSDKALAKQVTAQDIVTALVDMMSAHGAPVTSRARGVIGKQAKDLLKDGFRPEVVYAAAAIALRRGQPHITHHIAQDIVLTETGQHLTRAEYQRDIARAKQNLNAQAMREADARLKENIHAAVRKKPK
jgi:hypothetical protein